MNATKTASRPLGRLQPIARHPILLPRIWVAIQLSILIAIFLYYFVENFVLSSNWNVLMLRSVDDMAMQMSIRKMQELLLAGKFLQVVCFFEYGYGNIFWLVNSLLLLPFYWLDLPQAQIVVGRQISLGFIAGSIYLIGLIIDRLHPGAKNLKYPVLIALAAMPMQSVIATKLHVNAQSIFFGILAYYMLVRRPILTKKTVVWTAIFAGIAVGLKLTGIFVMPLVGGALLLKLKDQAFGMAVRQFLLFCVVFAITAVGCTAPVLLMFPFHFSKAQGILETFAMFKNLNSNPIHVRESLFAILGYYLPPSTLIATAVLTAVLIYHDVRAKRFQSSVIAVSVLLVVGYVFATVHKNSVYLATYIQSVSFFIPVGLLGIAYVRLPHMAKVMIVYLIIGTGIYLESDVQARRMQSWRFFKQASSPALNRRLIALSDLTEILGPLPVPVKVLQDCTSVFPVTPISAGVDLLYNYGNLKDYDPAKLGSFDYIVLTTGSDFFGHGNKQEEAMRRSLADDGVFFHDRYQKIYEDNDTVLYRLIPQQARISTAHQD